MTETKVVVAAFEANGNGFSNCELVIRTVPGHITQQAADPSHLPAEVLEHLVDWALAGLEEQTPTADPGLSLPNDSSRRPATPNWLLETQLLLIRTVLATARGPQDLAEIDAELEVLRSRIAEQAAQNDVSAARAEARSALGDLNSELSGGDLR